MKNLSKVFVIILFFLLIISCKNQNNNQNNIENYKIDGVLLQSLDVDQLVKKGNQYFIAGNYNFAKMCYEEALKKNSQIAEIHFNLGLIYDNRFNYDKAMEEYQTAIRIKPDYIKAHLNLGLIYGKKKMYDKALKEMDWVLKKDPNNLNALYDRALILHKMNDPRAKKAWKTYINKAKDDPSQMNHLNKALIYLQALEDIKD